MLALPLQQHTLLSPSSHHNNIFQMSVFLDSLSNTASCLEVYFLGTYSCVALKGIVQYTY
jgi:hypothetical protein